jgi:hypothetical protein
MTIEVNVTGTQQEMEHLFDSQNIRFYSYEKEKNKWFIVIRHNDNIFKRVRTIKGLIKKFSQT